jgi:hypothetical protein
VEEQSMSCDLLLYWMTHKGEGSWAGFRRAAAELVPNAIDQNRMARKLKGALSDLAHVDFFVDGSQQWRVLPAMLAGLGIDGSTAILCGARTPELILSLQANADKLGCEFSDTPSESGPSRISLSGAPFDIQRTADEAHIVFVPGAPNQLLSTVDTIVSQIETAPRDSQPYNWDVESFDFNTRSWVEGLQLNAACKFTPRYGVPKFLLHRRHRKFLRLAKRDAVYAAAMFRGVNLLSYDADSGLLTAPLAAPMPEKLARIACLCAGIEPTIDHGARAYNRVPFDIASAILVASGQSHPVVTELARGG